MGKGISIRNVISSIYEFLLKDVKNREINIARVLDLYYIPTRYPNGFPMGAPYEHFTQKQAKEAIEYASKVLEFVRLQMGL